MENMDRFVNFLAKNSISARQKNRAIRGICRKGYQFLSSCYCIFSPDYVRRQNQIFRSLQVNTYPWPYREEWFANWEEDDSKGNYTLVCDNAGFVVKYSASYCAWKISELTGKWPTRPDFMESCDAKHWHQLLFHNNYRNTIKRPEPGKHYVGISPSQGEHGECVWFEGFDDGDGRVECANDTGGKIVYSTYRDKKYTLGATPTEWYIWVEIGTKSK